MPFILTKPYPRLWLLDAGVAMVGDVVLVRVHGTDYLHLIKAINRGRFLIGNNRRGVNGWVGPHAIYGIATKVEP